MTAPEHPDAPPPRRGAHLGYVPALDGLRAAAVLGVMFFHAGAGWLPGGFLGVDLFFVLSGFLITSLLLVEVGARGRIDLAAFWARRARRLLPALFVMVAAVAVTVAVSGDPQTRSSLRGDGLAAVFYYANWHYLLSGNGYFARTAPPSPLQHTWSLSIEEQFYLVWPLLVLLLVRLAARPRRTLLSLCLAGAPASSLLMAVLYTPGGSPGRVYYGTDTRAQSLLVGAAAAVVLSRRTGRASAQGRRRWALAGAVALVVSALLWTRLSGTSTVLYRGGLLAGALAAVVLIVSVALAPRRPVARLFALPPLVGVGRISYGLYLWHWPRSVRLGVCRGESSL